MSNLTPKNISDLTNAASSQEWNDLCDALKEEHGGYPQDWWSKVIQSGLAARVSASFTPQAPVNLPGFQVVHLSYPKGK